MNVLPWIGFVVLVVLLLALDLGILNRRSHVISTSEALRWTGLWVSLALCFNVGIYFAYEHHFLGIGERFGLDLTGRQAALQFLTAYLVEESLSIDNLFVIAVILRHFAVPDEYQHRVLFLGILGALVFRGIFIGAGLAVIHMFDWAIHLFGALLVYMAIRLLMTKDENPRPGDHPLIRLLHRIYPVTPDYHGRNFFVRIDGKHMATPLLAALLLIEASDIVFAMDSVPAVIGVTQDPFLAFTSNVFAILGLRSLYFALAAVLHAFRYVKVSLTLVLAFVGVKMLLADLYPIDALLSLGVIGGLLAAGVVVSIVKR